MNQNALVANANAGYVSNTVDMQLLKAIYNNEFITKEALQRVYDRSDNNFVATSLSATVGATWGSESSRFKHGLYLQWRDEYTLNVSKGLTGLVYFGNAPYENQTVSMNGTLKSLDYRKLQYVLTAKASSSLELSGSVGLVQASHAYDSDVKGSVFTATDGEYLNLDYAFDIKTYQAKHTVNFDAKGLTFGASLLYHRPQSRSYFTAGLQEAGFVSVPASSNRYKADTAVTFDGFHIGNVFGLGDSSFVNVGEDSIKRYLGIRQSEEKFTTGIPARFFAYYEHRFENNWNLGVESDYAPSVYKLPYVALHAGRWWKQALFTDLYLHTSTFNTLNVGLSVAANVHMNAARSRYLQLKAQTGYLNALVAPENTKGLDALVELAYRF